MKRLIIWLVEKLANFLRRIVDWLDYKVSEYHTEQDRKSRIIRMHKKYLKKERR